MKNIVILGHGVGVKFVIESLLSSNIGYNVVLVITHPYLEHAADLEMIEKRKNIYGDFGYNVFNVKDDYNIRVFESNDVNELEAICLIESYSPSYIISIGCRNIIKKTFLQRFPKRVLNIHTTPLPNYRGAASDSWMILNGEWGKRKYGCIHYINEGIDTGDIIEIEYYDILNYSYPIDVFKARMSIFKKLVVNALVKLSDSNFIPEKQNTNLATVFPRLLTSRDGHIDFKNWSGEDIIKFIFAFGYPFSGAFCFLENIKLCILKAEFIKNIEFHPFANGLIVGKNDNNEYKIAVKDGVCLVKTLEVNGIEVSQNKYFKLGKYLK
jgi:methionyl-tRNA formyltransferase